MEIDIKNLPNSPELLKKIIFNLHESFNKKSDELELSKLETASYKEKYFHLLEEIRLVKQHRFSPSSEKQVMQTNLFDEA